MFALSAAALNKALFLSENLVVDADRMRANVKASNGLMLAEPLTLALASMIGGAEARRLVEETCQIVVGEKRHLADVLQEKSTTALDWEALKDEATYFGSAAALIDRVLKAAEQVR